MARCSISFDTHLSFLINIFVTCVISVSVNSHKAHLLAIEHSYETRVCLRSYFSAYEYLNWKQYAKLIVIRQKDNH